MRCRFTPIKAVLAATVLIQLSLALSTSWATVFTWSGGGNDDGFDTALNRSGGVAPMPGSSTDLHFSGGVVLNGDTTLLFPGSGSVRDRVNNSGTLILGAGTSAGTGGYLNTGGLSEGTATTGPGGLGAVVGMGALTLRANATIDFTGANGGSELVFQAFNFISGTVANIIARTGNVGADGSDRLLFATDPNLTSNDLRLVQFTNDAGANFATGGMIIDSNAYYELAPLAPVPEPATWTAAAMTLLTLAISQKGRLSVLVRGR